MSSGSSPASEARQAVTAWSSASVHHRVAGRVAGLHPGPVLDVGCGDGALHEALPPGHRGRWVGIDRSEAVARSAPRPVVVGDARHLPVRSGSVAAVAALWMLYDLDEPVHAIAEAARVLTRTGELHTCSTRRDDSPELADHFENPTTTFDAEEAPELVAASFDAVEVHDWDAPMVHLPDRRAVVRYLRGRGASTESAEAASRALPAPLSITRRGSLVIGREPR